MKRFLGVILYPLAALAQSPFQGGADDGFASATLADWQMGPSTDPSWDILATASAAGGDGFSSGSVVAFQLSGETTLLTAFLGGVGDGFSSGSVVAFQFGGETTVLPVFLGGAGDGFSAGALANRQLGPVPDPAWDILATASAAGGDGFSSGSVIAFQFNGETVILPPFLGGVGDGFSSDSMAPFPMEFRLGSPVDFASYQAALFTPQEILAGKADPSADADGDGIPNLLEFVFGTDPRNGSGRVFIPTTIASPSDYGAPDDGNSYLTLDVPINPNALGVVIGIEFTSDLSATTWDAGQVLLSTPERLVARDPVPVDSMPSRFGRVTVREESP